MKYNSMKIILIFSIPFILFGCAVIAVSAGVKAYKNIPECKCEFVETQNKSGDEVIDATYNLTVNYKDKSSNKFVVRYQYWKKDHTYFLGFPEESSYLLDIQNPKGTDRYEVIINEMLSLTRLPSKCVGSFAIYHQ